MKITVDAKNEIGKLKRTELWQNSTLRYSPPRDFPAYCADKTGRAKIMRTWITLDEYWDYKTGEFYPDYEIGKKRYGDEELHYPYDWKNIVPAPSGTRFVDYLTSHAENADELMLNVRRLEREVSDGVITYEKYAEIFEKAVEYCKELAPNIRYIECCNEVELKSFGALTDDEYYKIYRIGYHAVRRLNEKHNYPLPLEYGGYAKACIFRNFDRWERFLENLAADRDEARMIDFYSLHVYNLSLTRGMKKTGAIPAIAEMLPYERFSLFMYEHNRIIKRLGLPEKPVFIDECGFTNTTGIPTDSQKNASGLISMLLGSAEIDNIYLFPWCTFHNPALQISFTQFLLLDDGTYAPTPCGNAIMMLHRLADTQLSLTGDKNHCSVATTDGEKITVIATNPNDFTDEFRVSVTNCDAETVNVKEYLCDSYRNNRVTGEKVKDLHVTRERTVTVTEGKFEIVATAEPYSFVFFEITK